MIYAALLEKDKDMGYIVSFPDLPNVNAFGATKEEALAMAKEALDGATASDLKMGVSFIYPKILPNEAENLFAVELAPKIEVAYKIFEARRGLKKNEVAKRAGMSPQAYQRFETPKGSPSVETLYKIAHAMGKQLEITFV